MGDKLGAEDGPWSIRVLGRVKGGETQTDYADNFRGMIAPMVAFEPDAETRLDLYGVFQYDNLRHTNGFFPMRAPWSMPRSAHPARPLLRRTRRRQIRRPPDPSWLRVRKGGG